MICNITSATDLYVKGMCVNISVWTLSRGLRSCQCLTCSSKVGVISFGHKVFSYNDIIMHICITLYICAYNLVTLMKMRCEIKYA